MDFEERVDMLTIVEDVSTAIESFLINSDNAKPKEIKKARKHFEKAYKILLGFRAKNGIVMYGPPEAFFSVKEMAEKELLNETLTKLHNKKLPAADLEKILHQIIEEFPESRTIIEEFCHK